MSVIYRGIIPSKNYSVKDFYDNGIIISWFSKFIHNNKPAIRCIFRSNGLCGEIRTTCYGNTYAVDVYWGYWTDEQRCLTTECKSIREAKSILFEWFKSKGFSLSKQETDNDWSKNYWKYYNKQLSLSPFIFKT